MLQFAIIITKRSTLYTKLSKGKDKRSTAVRKKPHLYGNSRATWDHTVLGPTCHPAEVIFPPSPHAAEAGTRLSDPGEMQG